MKIKETKENRLDRIHKANTTRTQVIPNKKRYKRKDKHKKQLDNNKDV